MFVISAIKRMTFPLLTLNKKIDRFKKLILLIGLTHLIASCGHMSKVGEVLNFPTMSENLITKPQNRHVNKLPTRRPTKTSRKYKIALFLPIESRSEGIKKAALTLLNASRLAYQELHNPNLDLIVYPTDGTSATLVNAAKLAVTNKIDLIIGPLLSPSVKTVRKYTEAAHIPMLAFSNDTHAVKGGHSYLLSYLPEQNVSNIVKYALSKGHKRFGVFSSNTPYGKRVDDIFRKEIQAHSGRVTNAVKFTENAADFYEKTKEIAEFEIRPNKQTPTSWSALLLADRAALMKDVLPLLERYKIDFEKSLILGTGIWNDPNILNIDLLEGAVFAAPNQTTIKIFENRYLNMFGQKPLTIASLAYDAIALASGLIIQFPKDAFSIKNITDPNGFMGVGGIFRFRANGMSERGLNIIKIHNHKFKVIAPAPNTFLGT